MGQQRRSPLTHPGPWLALLLLALLGLLHQATGDGREALAAAPEPPSEPADPRDDLLAFAELLAAYRAGDDSQLAALQAAAGRLAELHGRVDVPRVVAYYAGLDASERVQGLDAHDEVDRFHDRSVATPDRPWPEARRELLADLAAFVDQIGRAHV